MSKFILFSQVRQVFLDKLIICPRCTLSYVLNLVFPANWFSSKRITEGVCKIWMGDLAVLSHSLNLFCRVFFKRGMEFVNMLFFDEDKM